MAKQHNYQAIIQELIRRSGEEIRRLRDIEQRLDAMENRLGQIETTSLERVKKSHEKFSEHDLIIKDLNTALLNLKTSVDKMNRQTTQFARKRDLKEIERMFELLSPIRQEFLTRDELEDELKLRS